MAAKDVVEADLVQRDAEVEQLCAEVEDRDVRRGARVTAARQARQSPALRVRAPVLTPYACC